MRRRRPDKREITPDPIYNDLQVTKFVNYIMKAGKKNIAEKIFYGSIKIIESKQKENGIDVKKTR